MASALMILFLGCWLAGQSGVSGEGSDSAENQQPDSTTMEPEEEYAGSIPASGTNLSQPGATPTPAHPGGAGPGTESGGRKSTSTPPETDAGSIPAVGTDLTQPGQMSVPTRPDSTTPGGTNSTQTGTTPASTHPGTARPGTRTGWQKSSSNQLWKQPHPGGPTNKVAFLSTGTTKPPLRDTGGSEPSAAPGLTRPIIAGVSAAATGLLLLLLLAFIRYRRKGPAPRQSRESEPATTVYTLMGEGKQLDVLPQKPDPGTEGLTYAELDGQALQAKQGGAAPAPEPPAPEPPLYSTITMSQGPNGQNPQGAGEPPTDPHSVNPGGVTGETGQEASATTG